MRRFAVLALLLPLTATAVPTTMLHQGRLLDSGGVPLTGSQTVTFSIHDASASGSELWSEDLTVDFDNGYFSTTLGETTELDAGVLAGDSAWIELVVSGGTATDRLKIQSVAFAVRADTATNVKGGTVDASSVTVAGNEVINTSGEVPYAQIADAPAAIGTLGCVDGQIAQFSSGSWGCVNTPTGGGGDVADLVVTNSATLASADVVGNLEVAGDTTLSDTLVDGELLVSGTITGTLAEASLSAGRICPANHYQALGYCLPKGDYTDKIACDNGGELRNGVCYDWDGDTSGAGAQCIREDLISTETACASNGGRLCSVGELDRLDGIGCGGDHSLSWAALVSDPAASSASAYKGACMRRQGAYVAASGGARFGDDNDDIASCLVTEATAPTTRDTSFTAYRTCCYD